MKGFIFRKQYRKLRFIFNMISVQFQTYNSTIHCNFDEISDELGVGMFLDDIGIWSDCNFDEFADKLGDATF